MAEPISMNFGLLILQGTNSLVGGRIGMVRHAWLHDERHRACNGWYLGMEAPIFFILGLYSNIVGL